MEPMEITCIRGTAGAPKGRTMVFGGRARRGIIFEKFMRSEAKQTPDYIEY
jgi:hypothetical protein